MWVSVAIEINRDISADQDSTYLHVLPDSNETTSVLCVNIYSNKGFNFILWKIRQNRLKRCGLEYQEQSA
jgi:hypothetical protein